MSQEVIVTAFFTPIEGKQDELVQVLASVIPDVHGEPGCQYYALHDAGDGKLALIEKWDSQQALEVHQRAEPIKRLNAKAQGLLQEPPNVSVMNALPHGHTDKGSL